MQGAAASVDPKTAWRTGITCAGLLALFAALSWFAVGGKCATFDEPLDVTSSYLATFAGDYRIDAEDPPLWKYWAMLPQHRSGLYVEQQGSGWEWAIREPRNQSLWAEYILYQTTGIDGAAFLARSRAMFLLLGVILGAAIAVWTYRMFGAAAAIAATALYSLDPTALAHAPLVKNDLAITLLMLLFMYAVYHSGRRARWYNVIAAGLLLGAGLATKFSAILFVPMMIVALLARIVIGDKASRASNAIKVVALTLIAIVVSIAVVWGCYRFRFVPTGSAEQIDTSRIVEQIAVNRLYLREHRWASPGEARGFGNPAVVTLCLFAQKHHLMPQSWIAGFLFTYNSALVRPAFLLGRIYDTGCWYYFPLTVLFKEPVATLIALCVAAAWCAARVKHLRRMDRERAWQLICLAVPILIYSASAMSSNLNIGIRHLLPVMPFVFILVGAVAASLRRHSPRVMTIVSFTLGLLLAIETFAAFPDYIPFFNFAAGGNRAGLKLLADSNLDWGQDLPALSLWQQTHPDTPLYLMYFGRTSPEFYDIKRLSKLDEPCMLAISATTLQGIYLPPGQKDLLRPLWDVKPVEVLHGTIYLYRFPADMPSQHVANEMKSLVGQTPGATLAPK